jgi:hypothetical protein
MPAILEKQRQSGRPVQKAEALPSVYRYRIEVREEGNQLRNMVLSKLRDANILNVSGPRFYRVARFDAPPFK